MALGIGACPENDPQHLAHMELNGECPWCGETGESDPSLHRLMAEEAIEEIVRRHG